MTAEDLKATVFDLRNHTKVVQYRKYPGFIKGPIPLTWMQEASKLGGKAATVAVCLSYLAGLTKSRTVTLSRKVRRDFYLSRDTAHWALQKMENAALVRVSRKRGCAPVVTLLWEKAKDE